MWSPRTWLFYVFVENFRLCTQQFLLPRCVKRQTQVAQTQINTQLKVLQLEKYPPTDIVRSMMGC